MDWRIKAAIQAGLARMPGGASFNDFLQRTLGGRRDPARHIDSKVEEDWLVHVAHLRELGCELAGAKMVEIGTGWAPVLPLCFFVATASRCRSYDLSRHLSWPLTRAAVARLERHLPRLGDAVGAKESAVRGRWETLQSARSLAELLDRAAIEYHAPADATATDLPPASVDLVFSNSVLEHVPPAVLDGLMQEARRILRPSGLVLHGVNCGDHYAYFDGSITPIHYLRFTTAEWQRYNNDLLFQNRLRPRDFLAAARRAGLKIVLHHQTPRQTLLARLGELPIAPEFADYPPEELCSTSIDFGAMPE
jgi:SAM-dependent methyltransferase